MLKRLNKAILSKIKYTKETARPDKRACFQLQQSEVNQHGIW
jgi:hypothetical protein